MAILRVPPSPFLTARLDAYNEAAEFVKRAAEAYDVKAHLETCAGATLLAHEKWVRAVARRHRLDSWANAWTGHGTGRDKTSYTLFQQENQLDFQTLEALYHNEDLAARGVDAVVEQVYREGFEVRVEDEQELGEEVAELLDELNAVEAFEESAIWARLYGGGAVFVGAQDGREPQDELDLQTTNAVTFLQVIDRFSLWPNTWYSDPDKPKFGMPETYRIFTPTVAGVTPPVNVIIHESRLITFPGARTSIRKRRVNFGWDDSVLQRPYQIIRQFGLNWAAATHLLSDAAQGKYKVKNLLDMIAGQNKEALLDRMATVDMGRSTARMVMVDADEEDFERTATPFNGIPEMLDRSAQRLAAAFRTPVTVLMGMSPAGLNATGDSDIRQWYDQCRIAQKRQAAPRVKKLAKIVAASLGKRDVDVEVYFPPLWQPTVKEKAEARYQQAQTDDIYMGNGCVLPEEIRKSRFGGDGYSDETTLDPDVTPDDLAAATAAASGASAIGGGKQPGQVDEDPNAPSVRAAAEGTPKQRDTPSTYAMPDQSRPDLASKPKEA